MHIYSLVYATAYIQCILENELYKNSGNYNTYMLKYIVEKKYVTLERSNNGRQFSWSI